MKSITIFSTSVCQPCRDLKSFLDRKMVKYKSIDVTKRENDHYVRKYSISSVPFTILVEDNGNEVFISGFNQRMFNKYV